MHVCYLQTEADVIEVMVSVGDKATEIPDELFGQYLDAKARLAEIERQIVEACDAASTAELMRRESLTPRERRKEDFDNAKRACGLI